MTSSIDRGSPMLTIVLGMHRSGTSLCSSALSLLGLDMADEITPNDSNARGHWERWEIVKLNDRVLQHFGQDYYDQRHALALPPGWWVDPAVRRIRDEITGWLRGRMASSRRFGLKDPRISRLLPMWREILVDLEVEPRFVFCIRPPDAVASSLAARDKLAEAEGDYRWLVYNADVIDGLGDSPVTILSYDRWFTDPLGNLRLLDPGHGRPRDEAFLRRVIETVLDPTLRHHVSDHYVRSSRLGAWLYRLALACPTPGSLTPELRNAAAAFISLAGMIGALREEAQRLRSVDETLEKVRADVSTLALALETAQNELAEAKARLQQERLAAAQPTEERVETRGRIAPQRRARAKAAAG